MPFMEFKKYDFKKDLQAIRQVTSSNNYGFG